MTVETVKYIDSLDPSNPKGSDPISEGDGHISNIKSALKETFPNIKSQVTATAEEINMLSSYKGNGVFAALKYNGATATVMYGHNIQSVTQFDAVTHRVYFDQPTDGFDHHYSVMITPIAQNGRPVVAMVTDQRATYCQFNMAEWDGSSLGAPIAPCGFYMTMVDMEQTEVNAGS